MDERPTREQVLDINGRRMRLPLSPDDRIIVAAAHAAGDHPTCLCTPAGVPMYVARLGGRFRIKRMPGTGPDHAPRCPSYQSDGDMPPGAGAAGWAGYPPAAFDSTMPGLLLVRPILLDDLWQRAHLTTWTPAMAGKRTWRVVSCHLRHAASGHYFRGGLLDERLFIPEPFTATHKAEIAARRAAAWAPSGPIDGAHHFMTLLGEVKALDRQRLVVKHLPDAPLRLDDVTAHSIQARHAGTMGLWRGDPDGHLVAVGTFTTDEHGAGRIHALTLAMTDHNWLPYRSPADRALLRAATHAGRGFTTRPPCGVGDPDAPDLVFTDTPTPTAAYVRPPRGRPAAPGTAMRSWTWRAGRAMPPLPPPACPAHPDDRQRPGRAADPPRSTT